MLESDIKLTVRASAINIATIRINLVPLENACGNGYGNGDPLAQGFQKEKSRGYTYLH